MKSTCSSVSIAPFLLQFILKICSFIKQDWLLFYNFTGKKGWFFYSSKFIFLVMKKIKWNKLNLKKLSSDHPCVRKDHPCKIISHPTPFWSSLVHAFLLSEMVLGFSLLSVFYYSSGCSSTFLVALQNRRNSCAGRAEH